LRLRCKYLDVSERRVKIPTGTALRIYLALAISSRPLGVRELQHMLNLKSPSTVKYHLDRLRMQGLVRQLPDGRYVASRSNDPILNLYIFIRATPIPRLIPISLFFTVFSLVYLLLSGGFDVVLAISLSAFCSYVIYEAIKIRNLLRYLASQA